MRHKKITATIILYNPDKSGLIRNLRSILEQVSNVILVDNSKTALGNLLSENFDTNTVSRITYIFNDGNLGVAKAQNIGLRRAIAENADYCLIFDQDSLPEPDMVQNMYDDYQLLLRQGNKIAAIGPVPINKQTGKAYEPRVQQRASFENADWILKVNELISSGLLVERATLEDVGLMDERLFIDGVDHEWCWRAKEKGYACALTYHAKLEHMLGEGDRKIMGARIAITSPFRVFYQYRNYIYLCRRKYVPTYWKLNNGVKYAIKLFYYPLFVAPRTVYLRNMINGIRAGFRRDSRQ